MCLSDVFVRTAIIDGGPSVAKTELVGLLLTLLAESGHLPVESVPELRDAVLRREQLGSTGIGRGLAIPHARHAAVTRPLGVLAVCRPPVEFDALDGERVDIVALVLTPPDRPGQHLGGASRGAGGLVRRLADEELCGRLRQAESAEEVEEILRAEDDMTRREWSSSVDPVAMLRLVRDRDILTERKARLFGFACCRRHWELLPGEARNAVDVAERFAEGEVGYDVLDAARMGFTSTGGEGSGSISHALIAVSYLMGKARHDPFGHATDVSRWAALAGVDRSEESVAQTCIIRCLFGSPPFQPVQMKQEWLVLNEGVVPKMGGGIYEERDFSPERMGVLADALEEAGADALLMDHLRGPGPHARGDWVIDLLTGRE